MTHLDRYRWHKDGANAIAARYGEHDHAAHMHRQWARHALLLHVLDCAVAAVGIIGSACVVVWMVWEAGQ